MKPRPASGPASVAVVPLAAAAALAAALAFGLAPPAAAQTSEDIRYTVKPGDSLSTLARRLLDRPDRWRDVQDYNGLRDARRMRVGTELRFKPEWLPPRPASGRLEAVGGTVTAAGAGSTGSVPAADGTAVGEGSVIDTGADGTAVIVLGDGTRLRIPPASRVRFERLRQYHGDDAIEARLRLERGAIEPQSSPRKRPLTIQTPAGNAAVRGTEFRVRTSGASGRDFVEVLGGLVEAGSAAGRAEVSGGNGAVVSATAAPRLEALLPAPDLRDLDNQRYTEATPTLALRPVTDAAGYRLEVASDQAFVGIQLTTQLTEPVVALPTRHDGPLYLRLRATSASGLEGLQSVARIEIQARPFAPRTLAPAAGDALFAGPIGLRWVALPGLQYRVQIGADERFERVLDEAVVQGDTVDLTLPPGPTGPRWWRIAAIEPAAGAAPASDAGRAGRNDEAGAPKQGPFSAPQPFTLRVAAPIVRPAGPVPMLRDGSGEPIRSGDGGIVLPGY
ncbi:MAG: FecR domain-containing protein [Lautropia sp.]